MKLLLATQTTKAISLLLVRPLSVAIKKREENKRRRTYQRKLLQLMNIVAILSAKKLGFLLAFANDVSSFFFFFHLRRLADVRNPLIPRYSTAYSPSTIGCITLGDM